MDHYVGLDVSLKETHICVLASGGRVVARGCVETAPLSLALWLSEHARGAEAVVLETGGLSSWLSAGLIELGVPAVIVDARLAKKALSGRANKSDVPENAIRRRGGSGLAGADGLVPAGGGEEPSGARAARPAGGPLCPTVWASSAASGGRWRAWRGL